MTDKQLGDIKFSISKLSLKLGGIKTEIKTGNGSLEKTYQSIDKVVSILERGFKSMTLKGNVSGGMGGSLPVSKNMIGAGLNSSSGPSGVAMTITKPIPGKTVPQSPEKNSKEFKLTPITNSLSKLEKAIESPRKAIDNLLLKSFNKVDKVISIYSSTAEKSMDALIGTMDKGKQIVMKGGIGFVDGVKKGWNGVGNEFKKIGNGVLGNIKEQRSVIAGVGISAIQGLVYGIDKTIGNSLRGIDKGLMGTVDKISTTLFDSKKWKSGLKNIQGGLLKGVRSLKKKIESITINPKKMFDGLKKGMEGVSTQFGKGVEGMTNVKSGLEGMNSLMKSAGIESSGLKSAIAGVSTVLTILSIAQSAAAAGQWAMSAAQWAVNVAMGKNPIGLIIIGIIGLLTVIAYAWDHFEGFRGTIVGMWEVLKSFGTVIKDYVINRFKDILSGITGLGSALVKLFSGDFSGAWKAAKKAGADFIGTESNKKLAQGIVGAVSNTRKTFDDGYTKGVNNKFKFGKFGKDIFSGKKNVIGTTVTTNKNTGNGKGKVTGAIPSTVGKTIKIDTLVKEINITTTTLKQSSSEIKKQIENILLKALQGA